ncbi:aldose 1-epimerase [Pseudomonas stutzeri]|uniref:Aldose 1-epimerase n=1 Tax=Stutzerimonas stutzeri TaxID=316 RepID=A0A2N8S432_STUST|nr:aldose 1-epimerase [Stutzerimonas stutzeri]MCQ4294238.1 aldose 1-epimerase [Stutzerimonas stutzeri]PNF81377.1 aldose 1-epimerase [Stutzerimonas stutzeri]
MATFDQVHLAHAGFRLSVCPALGGAVTRFALDDFDLLRPWDGSEQVRRASCFVLAPYSNRIGEGRFDFDGSTHRLRRNSPDHALPIHGLAWKRAWQLEKQGNDHLLLSLTHDPTWGENALDWPFAFELEHEIRLDQQGAWLRLALTNRSDGVMPAGLGWHPYFPRHDGVTLGFAAKQVWLSDEQQLPHEAVDVPPRWDYRQARELGEPGLDHCFSGWDAKAALQWPAAGVTLQIEADSSMAHLVVYTPPAAQGLFAVEPVSHLNNALNQADPAKHGVVYLQPGERLERHCRMRVSRS